MTEQQKEAMLDALAERFISRKFLAWLTATGLMVFGTALTSGDWVTITGVYIGSQGVIDAISQLKGHK
jgi:urocanate hydratase